MQRFTDLVVWRRSHGLALEVYRLTSTFPGAEQFGLSAQVRRAAVSVAANIAEGSKREGRQDYARFLNVAQASLAECQSLLMICRDLGYGEAAVIVALLNKATSVARMLHRLRERVVGHRRRLSA